MTTELNCDHDLMKVNAKTHVASLLYIKDVRTALRTAAMDTFRCDAGDIVERIKTQHQLLYVSYMF